MDTRTKTSKARSTFIVWKGYQRRSEVLAPLLNSDLLSLPHRFRGKIMRPFDYLIKLARTTAHLLRVKPAFIIIQAPPVFAALAALLTRTPYVVDVHNGQIQSFWGTLPLADTLIRHAAALVVHNTEMKAITSERFPKAMVFTIPDPLSPIGGESRPRDRRNILAICSFDYDEPIAVLLEVVRALPEYTFTFTADTRKLPPDLGASLSACSNVRLTGFLSTHEYHAVLCSSKAAVVLTTMPAVQPSGACEALSSNTPLVLSRTALTEALFGEWAQLADNNVESLVEAIRSVDDEQLDLAAHVRHWNDGVTRGIADLEAFLSDIT